MIKGYIKGLVLVGVIALLAMVVDGYFPNNLMGPSVFALVLGMLLNRFYSKDDSFKNGVDFSSKTILRMGIILMGISLSFGQVMVVGKYALVLMAFTLTTAFGGGYLLGRLFKVDWKLTSLLSFSTAICGGSAVATLGPVIEAKNRDIAYAISATFIFDILTVILFPYMGMLLGMGDTGFGLWVGTAINDTSSVVAAGYAFSDVAGSFAMIVKLTRTLFIVPIVLIYAAIYTKKQQINKKVSIRSIFPWFILGFILMVAIRSTGILPINSVNGIAKLSKFLMVMALGAIGLKTSISELKGVGIKPMVLGVSIDTLVVVVALVMQAVLLKYL